MRLWADVCLHFSENGFEPLFHKSTPGGALEKVAKTLVLQRRISGLLRRVKMRRAAVLGKARGYRAFTRARRQNVAQVIRGMGVSP